MSVVAGCITLESVIIGADCRVTEKIDGNSSYSDYMQKVFALSENAAVGFVGDNFVAGSILLSLFKKWPQLEPLPDFELKKNLRACLQSKFQDLPNEKKQEAQFMIVGALPSGSTIVSRKVLNDLLYLQSSRGDGFNANGLSSRLVDLTMSTDENVEISDSRFILFVARSPEFNIEAAQPLTEIVAIGSGKEVQVELQKSRSRIVAQVPPFADTMLFRDPMTKYMVSSGEMTLGGLLTVFRVTSSTVSSP